MKALVAIGLVASCAKSPDDVAPVKKPAAPGSSVPMTEESMKSFVRVVDAEVPTTAAELQPWLATGAYKVWAHESKQHESGGPHAETVVTFISPSLAQSLAARAAAHPRGAASVKELYKAGKHVGWAVSVKTTGDSASGKNWYWYEVFSTAPAATAPYQGVGLELCRDCHNEGGSDQVLISYPLQ
jgi:hypothetical protein